MTRNSFRKAIILPLLFSLSFASYSQSPSNKDYIRTVQEADQYFYFSQDYESSSRLYAQLLKQYPDNSNLQAKLGISYLNVDGKKAEALKLIKKASLNVIKNDNEYTEYGRYAPLDTWFYLAHAYHENDSLQKAIDIYSLVRRKIGADGSFRVEYIDNQIKACYFAMEAEPKRIMTKNVLFTPWLSDYPGASNPVLSLNDSVFIFTVRKDDGNHIYCSYRNSGWEKPIDITSNLSGFDRLWSNSITGDGKMLVLYMDDGADGNLYFSRRSGREWSKVRRFGKSINTKYWEAHGTVTPDGKRLYFSSNREGGSGELDIWMSELMPDGSWGKALNLGNRINTPLNDNTPFFDTATSSLIFSSEGHPGMGGYDLFISSLSKGVWSEPIGLPSPVNTTGDNSFLSRTNLPDCYLSSLVDEKTGIRNIYNIFTPEKAPDKIIAEGNLDLTDGMNVDTTLAQISIKSSDSLSQWRKLPVKENGKFQFVAPAGNYRLHISYAGYTTDTINLSIPSGFSGNSLSVKSSLIPDKVSNGDFLALRNILFDFNSDSLNSQARIDLDRIADIISRHPGLKIEITGFADSKGDQDYNQKLSGMRADAVIRYLKSHGSVSFEFIRKAAGANGFIALNQNPDGTDNPAGRQFNRRVSLGIVNPQTGIVIRQEPYAPPQLRYPYSTRFSIVLVHSREKFFPDYFRDFSMNELLFVRPVLTDSVNYYVLGEFSSRQDAEVYLAFARAKGFNESYIIDQYTLSEEPKHLIDQASANSRSSEPVLYVIQIRASATQINLSDFKGIAGIREVKGKDKYYRYVTSEYAGFSKAKTALEIIKRSGFREAFIKEYRLLISQ